MVMFIMQASSYGCLWLIAEHKRRIKLELFVVIAKSNSGVLKIFFSSTSYHINMCIQM